MYSQRLIFSSNLVGIGGIPSATTVVGFFVRGVGTECTGGDSNDGKVGGLVLSNGSTGRGGKGGWGSDPKRHTQFWLC